MTTVQKILDCIGYYRAKKTIKLWFFFLRLRITDAYRKRATLHAINMLHDNMLIHHDDAADVIVSLTSYGERVTDTLPCALYSLLQQTRLPNRIIVWLDDAIWNEANLPKPLKKLQAAGIEFRFSNDIRSYKKLIPTLKLYPHNIIITVDDDLYYHPQTMEWYLDYFEATDKRCVIGSWATKVVKNEKGYAPYSQWLSDKQLINGADEYILIGCGGILYAPDIFDEEILKEDLFMRFAPTADDIWFWVMEKRLNIPVRLIPQASVYLHTSVNRIEDWKPRKDASLFYINEIQNKNDEQLVALLDYYKLNERVCE